MTGLRMCHLPVTRTTHDGVSAGFPPCLTATESPAGEPAHLVLRRILMNRLLPVAGAIALAFATQGTALAQTYFSNFTPIPSSVAAGSLPETAPIDSVGEPRTETWGGSDRSRSSLCEPPDDSAGLMLNRFRRAAGL